MKVLANKECCKNCINKVGAVCECLSSHTESKTCSFLFTLEDKEKENEMYNNLKGDRKKIVLDYKYNLLVKKNSHY